MPRPMRQITIKQGYSLMTTWTDNVPKLIVGNDITLEGVDGVWHITRVYKTVVDISQLNRQRNFDNNNYDKHKGLGI